jgi:hypothetical protein
VQHHPQGQHEQRRLQQLQALRTKDVVTCFLSCSVRPADRPLVDAVGRLLTPIGFKCLTVGRNVTLPNPVDDAIKKLLESCDCLIGVATERLEAKDRSTPDRTLSLATPYLLQETSMAFQADLPFLIWRAQGVDLQAVTSRNLYVTIEPQLTAGGKVKFKAREQAVVSALVELKRLALARRNKRSNGQLMSAVGWLSSIVAGGTLLARTADALMRPPCFGSFYYQDPECKQCSYKTRCKAEKQIRGG